MSKAFTNLIEELHDKLEETRLSIDEAVNEAVVSSQEEALYPENVFAQQVIEQLADAAVISIPQTQQSNEHFFEHAYKGKVNRSLVNIWGSALFRRAGKEEQYELHLFRSDYKKRDELEEMTQEDYDSMFKQLFRFFTKVKSGELLEKMSNSHPAYKVAVRLKELAEQSKIVSIRSWILSNRVFASKQKNGRMIYENIECSTSIVDLKYLADMVGGVIEINQDFSSIGGIDGILLPAKGEQDYDCILSSIPGDILSLLYSNHGTAIVAANVRAYLGDRGTINAGILETIQQSPARFLAYNNGLVISADSAEFRDTKLYSLEGIQIINGGQTTASIYNAWLRAKNSKQKELLPQIERNLADLRVPMKIIVSNKNMSDDERSLFRKKISSTANSQNAVKQSDLSANDPFQIEFARVVNSMRTPENDFWFYERARGLYSAELYRIKGNRVAVSNFKTLHPESKLLGKDDLAMAYIAWEGQAQDCARGKEHAFSEFSKTVREDEFFGYDPTKPYELSRDKAQMILARWILFKALQDAVSKTKINPIKNPRIAVVYTFTLLGKKYGKKMKWDRIWSHQGPSDLFLENLAQMAHDVDTIIRKHLGDSMINMYGRQTQCLEVLTKEFSFENRNFDSDYELS